MLLEVPQLPGKFQQMMARPVEGMAAIQRAIDSVSHYLVLKTAISIITGLVAWAMLAALDVRFAFVWGLLAFALNYIPNIGSVLAAIPPIAQVLVFNGFYEALLVLAGYLLINLVFGNILEPRIMGRGLYCTHFGGIFVVDFLGMVVRTGGYAAFRAVDNYCQNCA